MSGPTTFLGSPESRHKVSTPHQGSSPGWISIVGMATPETLIPSAWPSGLPPSVPISVISQTLPGSGPSLSPGSFLIAPFSLSSGGPEMQNTWFMGTLGVTVQDCASLSPPEVTFSHSI